MSKKYKKFIALATLINLLGLTNFYNLPLAYAQAEAVAGVAGHAVPSNVNVLTDTDPVKKAAQGQTALGTYATWLAKVAEKTLKASFEVFKHAVLRDLTKQITQWIKNNGKGSFVLNWDKYLEDAGQRAAGIFIKNLSAGFLCEPFGLQIQFSLIDTSLEDKAGCTLNDLRINIGNFYDDFRTGGWIAYQESLRPVNNFYGTALIALDEKDKAVAKGQLEAQNEALAGQGFLPFKVCDDNGENCHTTTPGQLVRGAAQSYIVDKPLHQVVNAGEYSQYLDIILNTVINQFVKGGIKELQDLTRDPDLDRPRQTIPCAGLTGEAFTACAKLQIVSDTGTKADRFSMLNQIDSALEPRKKAQEFIADSLDRQSQLTNALAGCSDSQLASLNMDISLEQATFDKINQEFDDNQTAVDQLQNAYDTLNNSELSSVDLNTQFLNIQSILDPTAARQLLTSAEEENGEVKSDVEAKLPSAQSTCPQPPTT